MQEGPAPAAWMGPEATKREDGNRAAARSLRAGQPFTLDERGQLIVVAPPVAGALCKRRTQSCLASAIWRLQRLVWQEQHEQCATPATQPAQPRELQWPQLLLVLRVTAMTQAPAYAAV